MSGEGAAALAELLDRLNTHAPGDEPRPPLSPAQAGAMYLVASDVVDGQLDEHATPEVPTEVLSGAGRMLAAALRETTDEVAPAHLRSVGGRHRRRDWR